MFSLSETFHLITDSVPQDKASDLIKKCKEIGIKEQSYINTGLDSNLPEFDKVYTFVYEIDNGIEAILEILEKNSAILQSGIQIIYPYSFLLSKVKKHFILLKNLSDNFYGSSLPINISGTKILNYGNLSSVCYLSKMKINSRDVINFRVGNKKFWG